MSKVVWCACGDASVAEPGDVCWKCARRQQEPVYTVNQVDFKQADRALCCMFSSVAVFAFLLGLAVKGCLS